MGRTTQALARALTGLAAMTLIAPSALAQGSPSAEWAPQKPLRLIVPNTPGGGADAVGRIAAATLAERLGQQVVVENRPGANGNVAAELVMRAPADGYTLMLVFTSMMAINPAVYAKTTYDPVKDFRPIGGLCDMGMVLIGANGIPAADLRALVALAKERPQEVFMASSGNGTFSHMLGEILNARGGLKVTHVPYKGEAAAVQDVIGNQNRVLYFSTLASVLPHATSGRMRLYGTTSGRRLAALPDLPTFREQGFDDVDESFWYGLVAAAGTPPEIAASLDRQLFAGMSQPAAGQAVSKIGCAPMPMPGERLGALVKTSLAKYSAVARAVGMRID
jgi:tripartite-type tricarboxylate transporter receptor subunit TctC